MNELLFFQSSLFQRWVKKNRLRAAVERLQAELTLTPDAGDVIPGSGGLRKVRMGGAGRGKSGGFRVVYVLVVNRTVAYLVRGYSKSDQEDLSADELARAMADVAEIRPALEAQARDAAAQQPEGQSDG